MRIVPRAVAIGAGAALVAAAVAVVPAAAPAGASGTWQSVSYGGERASVPGGWQVYDLAAHPSVCPRFDRHAVYEGQSGPHPTCPAQALGVTEAMHLQPLTSAPSGALSHLAARTINGQPALVSTDDQVTHRIMAAFPGSGVLATISYGTDRALAEQVLGSFTAAPGRPAIATPRAAAPRPAPLAAPALRFGSHGFSGLGFDTCQAPSESTMQAWLSSPYRAVGVYIGGANRACGDGPLSAQWVGDEVTAGWSIWPMYVGLQAPCADQAGLAPIDPTKAAAEGTAAADDAASDAQGFGMGTGTTIYFDMEAYDTANPTCSQTVETFIEAWTAELHRQGYLSGFYSSTSSGIRDMEAIYGQPGAPDVIDFADWNGQATTSSGYIPATDWPSHDRLHQFSGSVNQTYDGVTINIDQDYADAPMVGRAIAPLTPAPGLAPGAAQDSTGDEMVAVTAPDGSVQVATWSLTDGWSSPQDIGGITLDGPSVASPGPGEFDVVVRGTDGAVWQDQYVNGSWSGWTSLGGIITSRPAAAVDGGGLYVAGRGTDGAAWERPASPAGRWQSLGGMVAAGTGPAAAVDASGDLAVFVQGVDGALWENRGGSWSGLGGAVQGDPGASSVSAGHLEGFVRGGYDGALWHRWWSASAGWSPWVSLGGIVTSGPAAATYQGSGRQDVFALGGDGDVWEISFTDGQWGTWMKVP